MTTAIGAGCQAAFKADTRKVENVKEVELFMKIFASLLLKEIFDTKGHRKLYTSYVFSFLKDDKHRDYYLV